MLTFERVRRPNCCRPRSSRRSRLKRQRPTPGSRSVRQQEVPAGGDAAQEPVVPPGIGPLGLRAINDDHRKGSGATPAFGTAGRSRPTARTATQQLHLA